MAPLQEANSVNKYYRWISRPEPPPRDDHRCVIVFQPNHSNTRDISSMVRQNDCRCCRPSRCDRKRFSSWARFYHVDDSNDICVTRPYGFRFRTFRAAHNGRQWSWESLTVHDADSIEFSNRNRNSAVGVILRLVRNAKMANVFAGTVCHGIQRGKCWTDPAALVRTLSLFSERSEHRAGLGTETLWTANKSLMSVGNAEDTTRGRPAPNIVQAHRLRWCTRADAVIGTGPCHRVGGGEQKNPE
jgi:hypothetical protein